MRMFSRSRRNPKLKVNESEIIQVHWISNGISGISGCLNVMTSVARNDRKTDKMATTLAIFFNRLGRAEIPRKAMKGDVVIRKRSVKSISSLQIVCLFNVNRRHP